MLVVNIQRIAQPLQSALVKPIATGNRIVAHINQPANARSHQQIQKLIDSFAFVASRVNRYDQPPVAVLGACPGKSLLTVNQGYWA
jgi:hypothetical protein